MESSHRLPPHFDSMEVEKTAIMVETATASPDERRGWIRRGLDWVAGFLPWGLGAMGLTWLFSQGGGEDSVLSRLEGIPVIGTIVTAIANLVRTGTNALRRVTNPEGAASEQGQRQRVDRNEVFEQLAGEVGGTADQQRAFANDLREIVRARITADTATNSTDETVVITHAVELRDAIRARIVQEQNARNPTLSRQPNDPQRQALNQVADLYANGISGAGGQAEYLNPNTAIGYLGMAFRNAQTVAAPGQFQVGQTAAFDINLQEAARAAASPNITPAPEGAPAPAAGNRPPAAPQAGR